MPQHLYNATIDCPLSAREAFLRLRQLHGCVWLDSARSSPQGDARYSLVAANPVSRLRFIDGRLERIDYSYISCTGAVSEALALLPTADPLQALENWLHSFGRHTAAPACAAESAALAFFRGGAVGYFSYEFGRQWEKYTPLAKVTENFPHMDWALYDCAIVCDHLSCTAQVVGCSTESGAAARAKSVALLRLLEQMPLPAADTPVPTQSASAPAPATLASFPAPATLASFPAPLAAPPATACSEGIHSAKHTPLPDDNAQSSAARRTAYTQAVAQTRAYIAQGDIYQTNIAQHFSAPLCEAPSDLYLRLRELNPAPYAAYLDTGAFQILSSSPELFLHKRGQRVLTRPIKGTRPRGSDAEQDARLCRELLASEKERAELLMIVDLERNDFGRVCEAGSVRVESLYRVETYATVHHLLADVSGTLRAGTTLSGLLRATFPGGSITGAPKVRAMEIIDELEKRERGIFCGAVGLLGADVSVDLNIAIRTLLCATAPDGTRQVHASVGAGLVWDSDPQMEYEETLHKAEALLKAINTQPAQRFI